MTQRVSLSSVGANQPAHSTKGPEGLRDLSPDSFRAAAEIMASVAKPQDRRYAAAGGSALETRTRTAFASGNQENIRLNKRITDLAKSLSADRNWHEWERLCDHNLKNFNLINCVTAFYSAAANVQDRDKERFLVRYEEVISGLLEKIEKEISTGDEKSVANAALALAKFNKKEPSLLQAIRERAQEICETFTPQGISNLAWALAKFHVQDRKLFEAISDQVIAVMDRMSDVGLANVAWAFTVLNIDDEKLFDQISARVQNIVGRFNPDDYARIAWAFAKKEISDIPLFKHISGKAKMVLRELDAINCAQLAWAFGSLGIDDRDLLQAIFKELKKEVRGQSKLQKLKGSEIPQVFLAIARLKVINDRSFITSCIELLHRNTQEFVVDTLANCSRYIAIIFNLYDLSGDGPSANDLKMLHEILQALDAKLSQMFDNKQGINEVHRNQLHAALTYLKYFQKSTYQPGAFPAIEFSVDLETYLKSKGIGMKPKSSEAHMGMNKIAEDAIGHSLTTEHFTSGHFLDTILDADQKKALDVVGPLHFLSSGGMEGEMMLRDRILKQEGWSIIDVSTKKWYSLSANAKKNYIRMAIPEELHQPKLAPPPRKRRGEEAGLEEIAPEGEAKKEKLIS